MPDDTKTIVVPAEVVADLRTGLYAQIGMAVELLESLTLKPDRERYPQRYRKPLRDLDQLRDAIGWLQGEHPTSMELDLLEHRPALLGGLQTILETIDQPATVVGDSAAPPSTENTASERARAIRALLCGVRCESRA